MKNDEFEIALLNLHWWFLIRDGVSWVGSNNKGYQIEMRKADLDALAIKHNKEYDMCIGG